MAYQQIEIILDHAEKYHHRVVRFYNELAESCTSERIKMLLAYLAEHERKVAASLSRYRDQNSRHVLGMWVTTEEPTSQLVESIDAERVDPNALTEDELIEMALRIDNRVIAIYEEISHRDIPPWVAEAFDNLLKMERSHEMLLATQAARGADL